MKLKIAFLTTVDEDRNPQIGDCIVITFKNEFPEGKRLACIIIDGGYSSNSQVISDYLASEKVIIIDLLIATHIDGDHIAGLCSFVKDFLSKDDRKFKLMNYWGPAPGTYTQPITITEFISYLPDVSDIKIDELSMISQSVEQNEKLYKLIEKILSPEHIIHPYVNILNSIPNIFNDLVVEVLAPDKQIPDVDIKAMNLSDASLGDSIVTDMAIDLNDISIQKIIESAASIEDRTANNQSIVIKLTPLNESGDRNEDCSILFPGDAEIESWNSMIDKWGEKLKSRVLKLSHHGSKTGTNETILVTVQPDYCVICAGKNKHGLPDDVVLKLLSTNGVDFFCTGRNTKEDSKKSPCIDANIIKDCPRWDANQEEHIKDTIIFNIDSDTNDIEITGEQCGVVWDNV